MIPFKRFYLAILTVILIITATYSCTSKDKKKFSETKWANLVNKTNVQDLYASHVKDNTFFSPWLKMPDKNFIDVIKWKLFSKSNYTAQEEESLPKVLPNTAARLKQTQGDFILWIGHNTFLVRINDQYWLTDPIFSKRALLPARVTPPALTIDEFNETIKDVNIVISHNHYDHLDRESIKALPENANVYVPLGLKAYVSKMNKKNVQEMDWWQEISVGENSKLICLPAQHWSLRINQGRNTSLWASWMLVTPNTTIYFGGDSGYFKGFKEIGKKFPDIDYAFLATTAYHPRWFMFYQHMNVSESIRAFSELGAQFFIPTQWGTFHLGNEPAGYPGLDLKRHIQKDNLNPSKFKILNIGQILPITSKDKL